MRLRAFGFWTVALGVLLSQAPAKAHHSFAAEFDGTKVVKMTGFVTKVEWTNPHVWFYINIKEYCTREQESKFNCAAPDASKNTVWGFEMGPPHGLQTRGWTR